MFLQYEGARIHKKILRWVNKVSKYASVKKTGLCSENTFRSVKKMPERVHMPENVYPIQKPVFLVGEHVWTSYFTLLKTFPESELFYDVDKIIVLKILLKRHQMF